MRHAALTHPTLARLHRGAASVAGGTMLIAAACFDSPGGRQENCVRVSPDRARFPVRRRPPTVQTQRAHHPGAADVAKAVGWRVACLPGGRVGWPSGKCRLKQKVGKSLKMSKDRDFSTGILTIIFIIVPFMAWFQHLYTCFTTERWGFLIAGAIFFPVAIIHGVGIWFGFWH